MSRYFLAIDIGASSGRHILGSVENGKIVLEEVYRFWNGMDHVDGTLCWDVDRLFNEIIAGMKKCKEIGKIPVSVGIDTWGVDFVLLDKEDNIVGQTVGYRDHFLFFTSLYKSLHCVLFENSLNRKKRQIHL